MEQSKAATTVVVVEPDVIMRTMISEHLRECGYRVIEAVCAEDVWLLIKSKERIDVVFAEVNLPGPSQGFALAKEVRQTNPAIDVILTAGLVDAAAKASDLCEEGPITKPYQPKEIVARIQWLLKRRRQSDKKEE